MPEMPNAENRQDETADETKEGKLELDPEIKERLGDLITGFGSLFESLGDDLEHTRNPNRKVHTLTQKNASFPCVSGHAAVDAVAMASECLSVVEEQIGSGEIFKETKQACYDVLSSVMAGSANDVADKDIINIAGTEFANVARAKSIVPSERAKNTLNTFAGLASLMQDRVKAILLKEAGVIRDISENEMALAIIKHFTAASMFSEYSKTTKPFSVRFHWNFRGRIDEARFFEHLINEGRERAYTKEEKEWLKDNNPLALHLDGKVDGEEWYRLCEKREAENPKNDYSFMIEIFSKRGLTVMMPESVPEIILELLKNAVKYSSPGHTIGLTVQEGKDDLLIQVCDGGIGIKEDDIKNLGRLGWRSEEAKKKTIDGFGYGLADVISEVGKWNGTVSLIDENPEGDEKRGALFLVKIPMPFTKKTVG